MENDLCIAGCGFHGNKDTFDLCSKCYKEQIGAPVNPPKAEGKNKISTLCCSKTINKTEIQVRFGDLTTENVDCIVNAANEVLDHGSGLAGAICKAGGMIIQEECDMYIKANGSLDAGMYFVGSPGLIPCKNIIHAVGPIYRDGLQGEDLLLNLCVRNCLQACQNLKFKSISIPAISSGIFNYPKTKCAQVLFETAENFINEMGDELSITEIRFTNFDQDTVNIFSEEFKKRFPECL